MKKPPNTMPSMHRSTSWFSLVIAVSVGTTAVLGLIVFLSPLPEDLPKEGSASSPSTPSNNYSPTASPPSSSGSTPVPSEAIPPAKVNLPTTPSSISAENLQKDLVEVARLLSAQFPNSPQALHVSATIYAELKQTKKSEEVWRKCIGLKPVEVGPYVGLASLLSDQGEDEQAIELLESARKLGSPTGELYQKLADAHTKMGELEKANGIVKQGLQAFPNEASLWLQLGVIESQLRHDGLAESALRRAYDLGDRSLPMLNALSMILTRQGKADEAKQYQAEVVAMSKNTNREEDPSFQDQYLRALKKVAIPLFRNAASVAYTLGQPDPAEQWLLLALTQDPLDGNALMELSAIFRSTKRFEDALRVHQRLIDIQPQNVLNFMNFASVASRMGKFDQAEKAIRDGIQRFPEVAFLYGEMAKLEMARSNFAGMKEWALGAKNLDPKNIEWIMMLAIAAKEQGDAKLLKESLELGKQVAPNDPRFMELWKAMHPE